MKNFLALIVFSTLFVGVNAQNSKKIKIVNLEPQVEVSCDKIPGIEKVQFISKCKAGELQIDYTDVANEGACTTRINRTYTVTDACGNSATFEQTIEVMDRESPKFMVLPPNLTFDNRVDYINSAHVKFPEVFDNCSNNITKEESVRDEYLNGVPKLYKTYIATDACGNKITHIQEITFNLDH